MENRVFRFYTAAFGKLELFHIWFLGGPSFIIFSKTGGTEYTSIKLRKCWEAYPKEEIPIKSLLTFGNREIRLRVKRYLECQIDSI